MRARLTSLLLATAYVVAVGCASKQAEEPSAAVAVEHACAASAIAPQANDHDTDIDSILTQPTSDRRLARINRSMYQTLRALDAELHREQRLAACEPHPLDSAVLQAQASSQQDNGGSAAAAAAAAASSAAAAAAAAAAAGQSAGDASAASQLGSGMAHATPNGAIGTSAIAHAASMSKTSSSSGRAGNGATAPKVVPGNDNDIVARRLRKAAEQETDPALRAKLWKEYTDYRQGTSAK